MQTVSTLWQDLASTGNFVLESKIVIGSTDYTEISSPVISRGTFQGVPSVGNCTAACLNVSLRTTDIIAKSAAVEVKQRLWDMDKTQYTEWITAGTFYISKRQKDYSTGLITLECYDAMLKGNDDFYVDDPDVDLTGYPVAMSDVVDYIAGRMGLDIDSRTSLLSVSGQSIPSVPTGQLRDTLGHIGALCGGNWIITPEGKLRLIPLTSPPAADTAVHISFYTDNGISHRIATVVEGSNDTSHRGIYNAVEIDDDEYGASLASGGVPTRAEIAAILQRLGTGDEITITGVEMTDDLDSITYTAGSDTGFVLSVPGNPYATQARCTILYNLLGGIKYLPFDAQTAVYDPAAEIGDPVVYHDIFRGVLINEIATLGPFFRGDISAPADLEAEDEYPYKPQTKKDHEQAMAAANDARKEAINYLARDNSGLMIADMSDGNTYTPASVPVGVKNTFIDSNSFDVRDGTDTLASFGEESRIGSETDLHLRIKGDGLYLESYDGTALMRLGSIGTVQKHITVESEGSVSTPAQGGSVQAQMMKKIELPANISEGTEAHVKITNTSVVSQSGCLNRTVTLTIGTVYTEADSTTNLGRVRYDGDRIIRIDGSGILNIEYEYDCYVDAIDTCGLLVGSLPSTASSMGDRSINVGDCNDTTYKQSGAIGHLLQTGCAKQFVTGMANTGDADHAFEVGNGTYDAIDDLDDSERDRNDTTPSNAFAIGWDGNMEMALDTTAAAGTVDGDLYAAITALGWGSEVIG